MSRLRTKEELKKLKNSETYRTQKLRKTVLLENLRKG